MLLRLRAAIRAGVSGLEPARRRSVSENWFEFDEMTLKLFDGDAEEFHSVSDGDGISTQKVKADRIEAFPVA